MLCIPTSLSRAETVAFATLGLVGLVAVVTAFGSGSVPAGSSYEDAWFGKEQGFLRPGAKFSSRKAKAISQVSIFRRSR